MVGRKQRWAAGVGAAVLLVGGYLTLDITDHVPGLLTTADAPRPPVAAPGASDAMVVPPPVGPTAPGAPATAAGAEPDRTALAAAVQPLLRRAGIDGPKTGALTVRDAKTGATLFDRNGDAELTPASTTKLLSAYATVTTLDPRSRLVTSVRAGADPGAIVLVAGGDSALATGAGDPDAVDGRAGLGDLADQVAARLKTQGHRSVRLDWDLSYAPGPATAQHWDAGVVDQGFTTRISMLGLARDRSHPGTSPPLDPARSTTNVLADRLRERGITVGTGKRTDGSARGAQLGAVSSAPVLDVMGLALKDSDNALTESLARQAAARAGVAGDTASVTRWVLSVLRRDGVDLSGVRLADASGLSDGTTIPVRTLAGVLLRGTTGASPTMRELISRLPVAALDGTLDDRFGHDGGRAGAGVVRAKTGSLPTVSSLAGTVRTDQGRVLVFAVIHNGAQAGGPLQTRADLDAIVAGLARCGC